MTLSEWIAALETSGNPGARQSDGSLLREAPAGAAAAIQSRLVSLLYSDPEGARRMSQAAFGYASLHPSESGAQAYAQRGAAHLAYLEGANETAVRLYESAAAAFQLAGEDNERARTQSSAIQALILLSRYEQARAWAAEAEETFTRNGDTLRLARLLANVGNIHFRQDRPREAVEHYHRALAAFRSHPAGEGKDVAAALSNLAVAHTNLGEFREALAAYTEAREYCEHHGLPGMAAQADYNIAYLAFLRGDYAEARRLYQVSRKLCEERGDNYHVALCDLDEAELSLELNLTHEGEAFARSAAARFEELGNRYEWAKALVNLAVAGSQRGDFRGSDRVLCHARQLFELEGNEVWPALIDLFRAVLAYRSQRFHAASHLSSAAWRTLAHTSMPGRAAHCQILRGRLWLRQGLAAKARKTATEAIERLGDDAPPPLRFHAKVLEGEAWEMQGHWREAMGCYEAARAEIEDLRGRLDTEDLRIPLLTDKLSVYEGLVALHLESPASAAPDSVERALLLVQQAKSRSLADRLVGGLEQQESPGSAAPLEVGGLREDLNWCYRQIEIASLMQRAGNPASPVAALQARARRLEADLLRLRVSPSNAMEPVPEATGKVNDPHAQAGRLLNALPAGTALLEYYESRDRLYLFVLTSPRGAGPGKAAGEGRVHLFRLGDMGPIRRAAKLLQFQLGRYRTNADSHASAAGIAAASHHLAALQEMLLCPACNVLRPYSRWVIAPHRELHAIPFTPLMRGVYCGHGEADVVRTPSASVYAACQARESGSPQPGKGVFVLAAPDARSPNIAVEAAQVAATIPGATLLSGPAATVEAFRQAASQCAILHLAAHGEHRRDNPMFSSLLLADGRLSLFDLSRTKLNAGLVVLSACYTGAHVAVGGDELIGLMRGFLSAGARHLVVSLWEVNDRTTSEFMLEFYRDLAAGAGVHAAFRKATGTLKERHPHPYYWAPFILVGT